METNYKSNSHKSKELKKEAVPEKNVQKVITGTAKTKKKSGMTKFADVFLSEDLNNVGSYIVFDVLIPACKKAVSDIVTNGIDMILYGGSAAGRRNSNMPRVSYRNDYRTYYDRPSERRPANQTRTRNSFNFDDIIIPSRGEAEKVLNSMDDLIETYEVVSVGDFYDLVGISDNNYMIHKYGWTNLSNAKVVRCRDGYLIDLPKALPID